MAAAATTAAQASAQAGTPVRGVGSSGGSSSGSSSALSRVSLLALPGSSSAPLLANSRQLAAAVTEMSRKHR
jgi:hypothetical protein